MRSRLLQPLGERRHARRPVRRRAKRKPARSTDPPAPGVHQEPGPREPRTQVTGGGGADVDLAVQRVREAGGPVDRAYYACACGLLFEARVSTTVSCPHCGAGQAW